MNTCKKKGEENKKAWIDIIVKLYILSIEECNIIFITMHYFCTGFLYSNLQNLYINQIFEISTIFYYYTFKSSHLWLLKLAIIKAF